MAGLLDGQPGYTNLLDTQPVATNLLDQRAALLDRTAQGQQLSPEELAKYDMESATVLDEARKGLRRFGFSAIASTQAFAGALVAPFAPNAGNELIKNGLRTMEMEPHELRPAVENWSDVHDFRSGALKFGSALGEGLPSSAIAVGAGLLGRGAGAGMAAMRGLRGTEAGTALAARTAYGAGTLSMLPQEGGETALELANDPAAMANTTPAQRAALVLGRGSINAALENVVPQMLVVPHMLGKAARIKPGLGAGLRNVGLLGAEGALGEYGTEFAQELTGQAAQQMANPLAKYDLQKAHEAGLSGAVVGAGLGGFGGAAQSAYSNVAPITDKVGELAGKVKDKLPSIPSFSDMVGYARKFSEDPEGMAQEAGQATREMTLEGLAKASEAAGVFRDYASKGVQTAEDHLSKVYDAIVMHADKYVKNPVDKEFFTDQAANLKSMLLPEWERFKDVLSTKSGVRFDEGLSYIATSLAQRAVTGATDLAKVVGDTVSGFYKGITEGAEGTKASIKAPNATERWAAMNKFYEEVPSLKPIVKKMSIMDQHNIGRMMHAAIHDPSFLEDPSPRKDSKVDYQDPTIMTTPSRPELLKVWHEATGTDLGAIAAKIRGKRNPAEMAKATTAAVAETLKANRVPERFHDALKAFSQTIDQGVEYADLTRDQKLLLRNAVGGNELLAAPLYHRLRHTVSEAQITREIGTAEAGMVGSQIQSMMEGIMPPSDKKRELDAGDTNITRNEGDVLDEEDLSHLSPFDREAFQHSMINNKYALRKETTIPTKLRLSDDVNVTPEELVRVLQKRTDKYKWEDYGEDEQLPRIDPKTGEIHMAISPMSLAHVPGDEKFRERFRPHVLSHEQREGASNLEIQAGRFMDALSTLSDKGLHLDPTLFGLPEDHPPVHVTADVDLSKLSHNTIINQKEGGDKVTWGDISGKNRLAMSRILHLARIEAKELTVADLKKSRNLIDKAILRVITTQAEKQSEGKPSDEDLANALEGYHDQLPGLIEEQKRWDSVHQYTTSVSRAYRDWKRTNGREGISSDELEQLTDYYGNYNPSIEFEDIHNIGEIDAPFPRDAHPKLSVRIAQRLEADKLNIDAGAAKGEAIQGGGDAMTQEDVTEGDWEDFMLTTAQRTQRQRDAILEHTRRRRAAMEKAGKRTYGDKPEQKLQKGVKGIVVVGTPEQRKEEQRKKQAQSDKLDEDAERQATYAARETIKKSDAIIKGTHTAKQLYDALEARDKAVEVLKKLGLKAKAEPKRGPTKEKKEKKEPGKYDKGQQYANPSTGHTLPIKASFEMFGHTFVVTKMDPTTGSYRAYEVDTGYGIGGHILTTIKGTVAQALERLKELGEKTVKDAVARVKAEKAGTKPEVEGENIASPFSGRKTSPLAAALTNVTFNKYPVAAVPGLKTPVEPRHGLSAEGWYQANKTGVQEKNEAVMQKIIEAKFAQYPELVKQITEKGGRPWIEASHHTVTGNERWEGKGLASNFLKVLANAYDAALAAPKEEKPAATTPAPTPGGLTIEESDEPTYRKRTIANVSAADVTVAIARDFGSAGEKLTKDIAVQQGKYLPIPSSMSVEEATKRIVAKMKELGTSLNIAGNGLYTLKNVSQEKLDAHVYAILKAVHEQIPITAIRSGGQTGIDEAGAKAGQRLGIPTTVLMPKGHTYRDVKGDDHKNVSREDAIARLTPKEEGKIPPAKTEPKTEGTTLGLPNRERAKRDVEALGLPENGSKETLYTKDGVKISDGYTRVVYGDHGPYIEIDKSQLSDTFKDDWTVKTKNEKAWYDEARPKNGGPMLYLQKRDVSGLPNPPGGGDPRYSARHNRPEGYADYQPGKIYISPFEVRREAAPKEEKPVTPTPPPTGKPVATMGMWYKDGNTIGGIKHNMRPEFKGKSTLDLIKSGDRTGTTRDPKYMKGIEVGDTITFTASGQKPVTVRVTKAPYNLSEVTKEEWSKLEGWEPELYDKILKADPTSMQFQYELLEKKPAAATAAPTAASDVDHYANVEKLRKAERDAGNKLWEADQALRTERDESRDKNRNPWWSEIGDDLLNAHRDGEDVAPLISKLLPPDKHDAAREFVRLGAELDAAHKASDKYYDAHVNDLANHPKAMERFVAALKTLPEYKEGTVGAINADLMRVMLAHRGDEAWRQREISGRERRLAKYKNDFAGRQEPRFVGVIKKELDLLKKNDLQGMVDEAAKRLKGYRNEHPAPNLEPVDAAATAAPTATSTAARGFTASDAVVMKAGIEQAIESIKNGKPREDTGKAVGTLTKVLGQTPELQAKYLNSTFSWWANKAVALANGARATTPTTPTTTPDATVERTLGHMVRLAGESYKRVLAAANKLPEGPYKTNVLEQIAATNDKIPAEVEARRGEVVDQLKTASVTEVLDRFKAHLKEGEEEFHEMLAVGLKNQSATARTVPPGAGLKLMKKLIAMARKEVAALKAKFDMLPAGARKQSLMDNLDQYLQKVAEVTTPEAMEKELALHSAEDILKDMQLALDITLDPVREALDALRKKHAAYDKIYASESLEKTQSMNGKPYTRDELNKLVQGWAKKYLPHLKDFSVHIFADEADTPAGFVSRDRPTTIYMSDFAHSQLDYLSTLAHEFGHLLQYNAFDTATPEVQAKIKAAWKADVEALHSGKLTKLEALQRFGSARGASYEQRNGGPNWMSEQSVLSEFAKGVVADTGVDQALGDDVAADLAYVSSFSEWFANQFSKMATHGIDKDLSPEEKSFWEKAIAHVKEFYNAVVKKLKPTTEYLEWIKSLAASEQAPPSSDEPPPHTEVPPGYGEEEPPSGPPEEPPGPPEEPPSPAAELPEGARKRFIDIVQSMAGPHKVGVLFDVEGLSKGVMGRFTTREKKLEQIRGKLSNLATELKDARKNDQSKIDDIEKQILKWEKLEKDVLTDVAVQGFIELASGMEEKAGLAEHETFHAAFKLFFHPDERRILGKAFSQGLAGKRLREIFKDDPLVLERIESSAEEAAAYAFEVWAANPDSFQLGPQVKTLFQRFLNFIRKLFDVLTTEEKAKMIMENLKSGKRHQEAISPVARKLDKDMAWQDRALRMAKDVGGLLKNGFDILLSPTYQRMLDTDSPAQIKIAKLGYEETGEEGNEGGMVQRGRKVYKMMQNKLNVIFRGLDEAQLKAMHNAMVLGETPTDPLVAERAKALTAWYREMYDYQIAADVLLKDAGISEDYYPLTWSPEKVLANKKAFIDMLEKPEYRPMMMSTKKTANEIYESITGYIDRGEDLLNVMGKNKEPLSESAKTRTLHFIKKEDRLAFMDEDPVHTAHRYMKQAVRQAEYVRSYGVNSTKLTKLTDEARDVYGATPEDLALINDYIDGLMGNKEIGMSRELKDLYGAMNVYQNYRLLPFSLFPSLIDPVGVAIRSGSMMDAWDTFAYSMKNLFKEWKSEYKRDFFETYAEDFGIVEHSGTTISAHNQFDGITLRGTTKELNDKLFKYNLLNGWIRNNTIMATKMGQRFIRRASEDLFGKHSERYLSELGLTKEDVVFDKTQDRLLLYANELEASGLSKERAKEIETKMANAIEKFVRQSLLNPSAAELPNWASNPYLLPIAHLKSFTFAFNATILNRIVHEFKHENYKPIALAAAYVPGMIAADFIKDMIAGFGDEPPYKKNWGLTDYFWQGLQRSGLTGTGQFMTSAGEDIMRGGEGYESWAGPAAQQFQQGVKAFRSGDGSSIANWMVKSMPLQPLYRQHLPGAGNSAAPPGP